MTSPCTDDEWDPSEEPPASPAQSGSGVLHTVPADLTPAELVDQVIALEGRLVNLPVIEQAKGALMVLYGLTPDAAFAVLRSHSQHRNIKVRDIAAQLVRRAGHGPLSEAALGEPDRLLHSVTDGLVMPAAVTPEFGIQCRTPW